MRSLRIAAVFVLFSAFIFSPLPCPQASKPKENKEEKKEEKKALDVVAIYDYYKDCAVEIQTTLNLENGMKIQFGGSGFFVENEGKKEGHVETVGHVVKVKGDKIKIGGFFGMGGETVKIVNYEYFVILTSKNKKYRANLVGGNVYNDTAVLKAIGADPADYNTAKLRDPSDSLKVGESVYVMGTPYGFSNNLTHGRISALHRYIDLWYVEDFIGTDAPINPGNSGGLLIDSKGNVIGLNDAIIRGTDGMGFAIPIEMLDFDNLKRNGQTTVLPWFGVEAMLENFPRMGIAEKPSPWDLRELYDATGLDPKSLYELAKLTYADNWAVVTVVDETRIRLWEFLLDSGSPAKIAGIKRGDLIIKIDGKPIKSGMDVRRTIMDCSLDQFVDVELIRFEYGVSKKLTVRVAFSQEQPEISLLSLGNDRTVILEKDNQGEYGLYVPLSSNRSIEATLLVKVKILKGF